MDVFWWILFSLDFLVYGFCCIMIIKRKNYTSISIRSPTLILTNILGNFFMSIIIVLFQIFDSNYISSFYYLFRLMMILSILLSYQRILICCRIEKITKKEEEIDKKLLSEKKYLFQEKFYVRLLLCIFVLFIIIMIIFKIVHINDGEAFFYTFNFIYYSTDSSNEDNTKYKAQMIFWIVWSFLEQALMITFIYRTLSKSIKEYIKTELLSFFIIWYIHGFLCSLFDYIKKNNDWGPDTPNLILLIITLVFQYICLFLNGYLPLLLSYFNKTGINYYFSPKLMNNLYLFLTNEECYDAFSEYLLKTNNNRGLFYLKLYTHIMKYKLSFTLNINRNDGLNEAIRISNTYFGNNTLYENQIDQVVLKKVRSDCQVLENNTFTPELFDEGLQFAFNKLKGIFSMYRQTLEYRELYNKIKLESYIQCKMCNTGLINKY